MVDPRLRLSAPVRLPIAVSVVTGLLVTACYVAQGSFLALALARLLAGRGMADVAWLLAGFVLVLVLRGALIWVSELTVQRIGEKTKESLRHDLLMKLAALGPGAVARHPAGELQTTIIAGVEALESYYSRYLPAIFVAVLGCGGILAFLAVFDWPTALVLSFFVVGYPLADWLWLRWRMPTNSGIFEAMGAFGGFLLDSLQGIVTLKAFNASPARRAALAERAARLRKESMTTLSVTLMRTGLTGFVTLAGVATVLSMNAWRVADGTLAPLALFMTLFLVREAFRPLDRLEKEFHTAWAASGGAGPIAALLAEPLPVEEPRLPATLPERHDIAFQNVTFAYQPGGACALDDISFDVGERELVALVGPSGAGKSTVISLLMRFFDPQAGTIRIGGRDISELSLAALRRLVSVVSQDAYLFHGMIEDNLRLAKPDARGWEIQAAAEAAHIHDFISSLPHGYATEIGERGTQLSGGQRQRLSIARALLKGAPILILDEATSSVDAASERAIQQSFEALAGRRTTLVIAHRLSTIEKADRILVMENGRIVEAGSHAALAARGGSYSRLMAAQEISHDRSRLSGIDPVPAS